MALVALLVAGGAVFAFTRGGDPDTDAPSDAVVPVTVPPTPGEGEEADPVPPVAEATPPPAESPAEVRVRVTVLPAGARIFLDDREFPNPLDSPRPRSLEPVRVRMELDGYETQERMIVFDSDARIEITLQPTTARPRAGSGGRTGSAMSADTNEGAMTVATPTRMDGFRESFD